MILEPRKVAPRALRRWTVQALRLIARGLSVWLGLILLLCLAMFAGQRLPLISGVLALMAFFGSILVAARLDEADAASFTAVLATLRQHSRSLLAFSVVIAVSGALVWVFFLARPEVPWWNVLYTERNIVTMLSENWFIALRQVFVYSAYALGLLFFGLNIPGLTAFLQFPCTTLLGLPFCAAYRAGAAAQMKNLVPMLGVGLLFILLPVAAVLLMPPAVPLLYCYLGALAYVSFREIFLGIGENEVRVVTGDVLGNRLFKHPLSLSLPAQDPGRHGRRAGRLPAAPTHEPAILPVTTGLVQRRSPPAQPASPVTSGARGSGRSPPGPRYWRSP